MKKLLVTSLLLSSASVFAAPFTVQDIRVEGTDPVTAENIIAGLPVKVGQRATDQDLSQIVRSLFLRGSYENVEAVREGNALVLRIQARPYISPRWRLAVTNRFRKMRWKPICVIMALPKARFWIKTN